MELEIIKHSDISDSDLKRVIEIKNAAWPHLFDSQLEWINQNQLPDDLHVILKDDLGDVAYLDMCPVKAKIDFVTTTFWGIGNVCTRKRGYGYGAILMKSVNQYLIENKYKGILFCRENLLGFYSKYGWALLDNKKISISLHDNHESDFFVMCFNTPSFSELEYSDRLF